MQECHSILFYLFRSRELQVIYFQRRDQRNCLKTIFGGWLFVVLVVQITPQLHHPWTLLSRPKSSETSGVTGAAGRGGGFLARPAGFDFAHGLPGLAHLGVRTHRALTSPVRFAPYNPRTAAPNAPPPLEHPQTPGGTRRTPPAGSPAPPVLWTPATPALFFFFLF